MRVGAPGRRRVAPGLMREPASQLSSPYQLHPLVATMWARRMAPRPVLAANDDYLPGWVNFSIRR